MAHRTASIGYVSLLVVAACGGNATAGGGGGTSSGDGGANGGGASSNGGNGSTGQLEDGLYFLTFSASILPLSPIVLATTIEDAGDGWTVSLQPLSYEDRSTPVGRPTVAAIPKSAGFALSLPLWEIPGGANAITGNTAVFDVVFTSQSSPECGGVSGETVSPAGILLDGSTFTLTPISDISTSPEPPPIDCAGNLADPLPL